jgi:hypothetical protein
MSRWTLDREKPLPIVDVGARRSTSAMERYRAAAAGGERIS